MDKYCILIGLIWVAHTLLKTNSLYMIFHIYHSHLYSLKEGDFTAFLLVNRPTFCLVSSSTILQIVIANIQSLSVKLDLFNVCLLFSRCSVMATKVIYQIYSAAWHVSESTPNQMQKTTKSFWPIFIFIQVWKWKLFQKTKRKWSPKINLHEKCSLTHPLRGWLPSIPCNILIHRLWSPP